MKTGGFTLLELLAVMGIIAIISGLAAPMLLRSVAQGEVIRGAQQLSGTIQSARALARRGTATEVRWVSGQTSATWGTRRADLGAVRIQSASGSLRFVSPHGRVQTAAGQNLPLVITLESTRVAGVTRRVTIASLMGKVVVR